MSLQSVITLNITNKIGTITFIEEGFTSTISYESDHFIYSSRPACFLTLNEFFQFSQYFSQYNSNLCANFPELGLMSSRPVPESKYLINISDNGNVLEFVLNTSHPHHSIYDITVNKLEKKASFAARNHEIITSVEEYILGYKVLSLFFHQVMLEN